MRLVLLDFDGTLVNTSADLVRTTNLFLRANGLPELPEATIRSHVGYGMQTLMLRTFPKITRTPEQIAEMERVYLQIYDKEFLRSPVLYPGALEFLQAWPGRVAIVSNKRQSYIHGILKHLGLDQWPWAAVIGGDTFSKMKPDPLPFLEAMKAAGINHAETVMIGDGAPDIEGARAVGIPSIAVSFGYSPLEELVRLGASDTIQSYSELMTVIDRCRERSAKGQNH